MKVALGLLGKREVTNEANLLGFGGALAGAGAGGCCGALPVLVSSLARLEKEGRPTVEELARVEGGGPGDGGWLSEVDLAVSEGVDAVGVTMEGAV
jgi:hypothetical protein